MLLELALPLVLVAAPQKADAPDPVWPAAIDIAMRVSNGLDTTEAERELMVDGVRDHLDDYAALRARRIPNSLPPAVTFAPLGSPPPAAADVPMSLPDVSRPDDLEDLAFWSVRQLAALVKSRQVSCLELTNLALTRLERLDDQLHCVIHLLPDRARARARELDAMLDRGEWLGPLHGIPFGAKDLLAARGAPTTWGAKPFEDQVIDADAAVIENLEARGAVLVAKLSLGALAWGDVWFGGRTRNPWQPEQGSSGSSAGPAAATAAGCVPFAIGSETLGSIISPSARCGCTGLRPTFGVVNTQGAMTLSWSMDKLGPICRSAEDAAIVYAAMLDDTAPKGYAFHPAFDRDVSGMRVGYLDGTDPAFLDELRGLGCELVPFTLPDYPVGAMTIVLSAEAAAAFDELTRSSRDELLVRQIEQAWPNVFRVARLIPAVEYLQAQRLRTALMRALRDALDSQHLVAWVHETGDNASLTTTNLTGHPSVVAPRGYRENGTPKSETFTGRIYGEADLLALVQAWQRAIAEAEPRRPQVH